MVTLDVQLALGNVKAAKAELTRVCALPVPIGAQVRWSNGLIWTRVGENQWRPAHLGDLSSETWPSRHIACSGDWSPVSEATS